MIAGDVFYFCDFQFADGTKANKLLIILNTPKDDEPYLVCLTTSQPHQKKKQLGCHSAENYYYVDSKQDNFDTDTWIVFEKIYTLDVARLLNSHFKDGSYKLFELEKTLWSAIKKCISQSEDVEQDYIAQMNRVP